MVLGGGTSPEREVSLRSAKAVAAAARQAGFLVTEADPAEGLAILDGIPKETIVLPILHGSGGEDGAIQQELEKRGFAYLGADSTSSKHCFDKWFTRQTLQKAGIPIANGDLVTINTYLENPLSKVPHVLKVVHGGSSIGTLMVRDPANVEPGRIKDLFELEDEAVIEELIKGIEITVPILDKSALLPIEIRPPENAEFDYANKYNGKTQELCPPPSLNEPQIQSAQKLAEQVHATMNCRHLSRTDMIMKPDGSFVVLEINTIPGLTDQSLYPKAASVSGIDMPNLVKLLVEMVLRDKT